MLENIYTIGFSSPAFTIDDSDKNNENEKGQLIKNMTNYDRNQLSFENVFGNGRSGVIFTANLYLPRNFYKYSRCLYTKAFKIWCLHEDFGFIFTSFAGSYFAKLGDKVTEKEKKLVIKGFTNST
ncbi:hypothetical protein Glove_52g62 [Diversispora epigaea]|uniref:Uncharacterized protein n=1 Tax=Diversispora epigaea TaxID=1348612 RepID=A0A397JDF1_9GLOM|nr:hypothetical protein Glove_52g62 [Diversispora epigaea]